MKVLHNESLNMDNPHDRRDQDKLIRTAISEKIATPYIETTVGNLVNYVGRLTQHLADTGVLTDDQIRSLCGFYSKEPKVIIVDRKDLD